MAINPHHLELFHYVVKFGGIAQASKNMPYGVGQSAISVQISRLESHLGVTLFQRRPFKLTPEGAKLHLQTEPFFRALDRLETEFRGGAAPLLRVGATELMQNNHLPPIFDRLKKAHPKLRFAIRDSDPVTLAELVRAGELDAALCLFSERPPKDLVSETLITIAPVLIVPAAHKAKKAGDILGADHITEALICLPPQEPPCAAFQAMLAKKGRVWEPSLELGSLPLVQKYTEAGYGVGLTVEVPGRPTPAGLRAIPLPDVAPLSVAVVHTGKPNPLREAFVAAVKDHVSGLLKK